MKLLSSQADEKGISLHASIGTSDPTVVSGDPQRVYQVLVNLVSNAVKFTSSGGVAIAMSEQAAEPGGSSFSIKISDTGIGISPEDIGQIFDKFVQADSSTTRRYGGTGLGLPIARSLTERMGGTLQVESVVGVGSIFTLTLTLPRVAPAEGVAAPIKMGIEVMHTGGRVLLVEDNDANIVVATALLDGLGYDVVAAGNGNAALKLLTESEFTVVLMDIQMDGMDGFETTRRFRQWEKANTLRRTPILAMTAFGMAGDRERCIAAGMDDYLAKPINIARFEHLLAVHAIAGKVGS